MKKISKLLTLLLALAMVFSLVACGTEKKDDDDDDKGKKESTSVDKEKESEEELTDEEMIVGEWCCSLDIGEAMDEMMIATLGDDVFALGESVYMNVIFEFDDEELELTMEMDEDSFEDYMKELVDTMIDYMYEMAEEQGMSKEDFAAEIEAEFDMSVEEYFGDLMEEAMEETKDALSQEGETYYYKIDADKNCIYYAEDEDEVEDSEQYMEYTLTEKKLTIKELEGEVAGDVEELEELGIGLPWKFEKQ